MSKPYIVHGSAGSGSVAVEAALTLIGAPYQVVEHGIDPEAPDPSLAAANPMQQSPALVLPSGELITESAAILVWLAEAHPEANLGANPGMAQRATFLRWMTFIPAQIYSMYWVRDLPSRLAADKDHEQVILQRTAERIAYCWGVMDQGLPPRGRYLLGDTPSVLDLYVTVVSRWTPRRRRFYEVAPRLAEVVRRVDAEPRLASFWPERFPFSEGWED